MKRFKDFGMATALMVLLLGIAATVFAENKSPMFSRQVPGGLFVVTNDTQTTGNIWFVDSGSSTGADAAGYGQNPDAPFLTIDYAIGNCTAANGDWIVIMPGHAESVSTAAYISADVAGVRFIGLGMGRNRPVLSWTASDGEVRIAAADVSFENIVFNMARTGGVLSGISVTTAGTDPHFKDCEFVITSVDRGINLTGGTRYVIDGCYFHGSYGTTTGVTTSIIYHAGALVNDGIIKNSIFEGYNLTAGMGLVEATSRVSGFTMSGVIGTQHNTGASIYTLSLVGLSSGVRISNLDAFYGGLSGTSSSLHWDAVTGLPYDTCK